MTRLFLIIAFVLFSAPAAVPAQTLVTRLPAFARSFAHDAESGQIIASMALEGIAVFPVPAAGAPAGSVEAAVYKQWPALDVLPLGEGKYLVAGRFGELRLLVPDVESGLRQEASWKTEGIPTHLVRQKDALLVASGAAGLMLYEWKGGTEAPVLRGRYPFVDYSKQMSLREDGILFMADNFDTGLQVLDVSDLQRPVSLAMEKGDFVDSVARKGDLVAISARRYGVFFFDTSDPAKPRRVGFLPALPHSERVGADVRRVAMDSRNRLLVCEGDSGARLMQLELKEGAVSWEQTALYQPGNGYVGEGIFLPDQRILLAGRDGEVYLAQ